MSSDAVKREKQWLLKRAQLAGIQLDPKALNLLHQSSTEHATDQDEFLREVFDEVDSGGWVGLSMPMTSISSAPIWSSPIQAFLPLAVHSLTPSSNPSKSPHPPALCPRAAVCKDRHLSAELLQRILNAVQGRAGQSDLIQVIDAFKVPYILYDPVRKLFYKSSEARTTYAEGKVCVCRRACVRVCVHVCVS